ncbi:hypothetical protein HAZT_HAZT011169 [Hyalella azteca]|uniref:protein-histidine N-methyltransferase n=1 Tax=Hyalella azteca TaxID=294128 RepID=A0A6A0GZ54_HYAAZ|nr:hypothetical protein HAZT_HAZT011169 [Hyalella azteca]
MLDCQTDTASPDVKLTWEPAHWYKVPNDRWEQIIAEPAELEEQLCRPLKIKFLSQNSITHVVEKCKESSVIKISEEQQSDLIPAVYEGGLKIWECTWDLLHYLAESSDILWQGKRVLELGCGAGILGIYAVLQGASVTLQDYNEDVIEHITAPNVLYNVAELTETSNESDAGLIENMHVQSNELSQFDVIMTSETIYNQENYEKILKVFTTCLKPHGVVYPLLHCSERHILLLAAKSYYFGVGGGTASFLAAVERTGCLQHKKLFEHTSGVRREIIEIRRVPYYILLLTLFCQSSESVTFQSPKNLFEQ